MAFDLYQSITDQIITAIESGIAPWRRPWVNGIDATLPTRSNGETYRGINVLLLWTERDIKGYASNRWYTYKQASDLGGHVRKGAKSSMVVYFNTFEKEDNGKTKKIPFLRYYNVFNGDLIDGLDREESPSVNPDDRIQQAERFIEATHACIQHGGDRACYIPSIDQINMPDYDRFTSGLGYYSTCMHELAHWTGHHSRLDRKFGSGDDYAFEELIAEISSCFVGARLGIAPDVRPENASYIHSWLQRLKNDKRYIFRASSAAQSAADHLYSYQS